MTARCDLWDVRDLPDALASLLENLVWCPVIEKWVNQKDRRRVFLTPGAK